MLVCRGTGGLTERVEQKANLDVLLIGMAERGGGSDLVMVAATDPLVCEVTGLLEVGDDALRRSLGYAGEHGYVPGADIRVLRDQDEDSSMTGQERPRPVFRASRRRDLAGLGHTCQSTEQTMDATYLS